MSNHRFVAAIVLLLSACTSLVVVAQMPLAPHSGKGQTVTPAFEGWYRNQDGTYSLSFGYFNRNLEEALEIPIGPDNYMEPGPANQGQPSHFQPRRCTSSEHVGPLEPFSKRHFSARTFSSLAC